MMQRVNIHNNKKQQNDETSTLQPPVTEEHPENPKILILLLFDISYH